MCSMCLPFCRTAQSLQSDEDAIHQRRWTIAIVSAMTRQSLVSVRQLRRNFDDGRPIPSIEGHPRWHNQPGSNPGYSVATCLAQWTARSHVARNTVRYYRNHSLDGATLFSKIDSNKLRFNVKNEMALIFAKYDADLINISKVTNLTSRKTKWPRFLAYPVVNGGLGVLTPPPENM